MFLFNKSAPRLPEKKTEPQVSTFKRDTLILDYLSKITACSTFISANCKTKS